MRGCFDDPVDWAELEALDISKLFQAGEKQDLAAHVLSFITNNGNNHNFRSWNITDSIGILLREEPWPFRKRRQTPIRNRSSLLRPRLGGEGEVPGQHSGG
jgi:hypothetical protein